MSAKVMEARIDAAEDVAYATMPWRGPEHMRECVRRMLVAADKARDGEAAEMDGWQPIETAPKDGSAILIYGGTYSYSIYADEPFDGVSIARWYRFHWRGEDRQAHDDWYSHNPTHWQPLPNPPQHSKGRSDG